MGASRGVPCPRPPHRSPLSPLLQSLARWESENKNKMVCEQRLLKGEGPKTGWSREMTNDGELILVRTWGGRGGGGGIATPVHAGKLGGGGQGRVAMAIRVTLLLLADHDSR